jgi:hypothetical protein
VACPGPELLLFRISIFGLKDFGFEVSNFVAARGRVVGLLSLEGELAIFDGKFWGSYLRETSSTPGG